MKTKKTTKAETTKNKEKKNKIQHNEKKHKEKRADKKTIPLTTNLNTLANKQKVSQLCKSDFTYSVSFLFFSFTFTFFSIQTHLVQ